MMNVMASGNHGLLRAALLYAKKGWKVFPLHHMEGGRCSCKRFCSSPGKHPRTSNGLNAATTDTNKIREWWTKWPDANIGIATGAASGIVVLDIDKGHGGYGALAELVEQNGCLPATMTVRTGGGGAHFYFQCPNDYVRNSQSRLGEGIDVRGDGGYVVAAPSSHKSGMAYAVCDENEPPAKLPQWLLVLLIAQTKNNHCESGGYIGIGSRNSCLMSYAGGLRRDGREYHEILESLVTYNEKFCEVPLPKVELEQIASSAARYPPKPLLFRWRDGWLSDQGPMKPGVRHALWALSGYMDMKTGRCYPTQEQLSKDTRMTRKTIRKYLEEAERLGWIKRERTRSIHGRWNYTYLAIFPE